MKVMKNCPKVIALCTMCALPSCEFQDTDNLDALQNQKEKGIACAFSVTDNRYPRLEDKVLTGCGESRLFHTAPSYKSNSDCSTLSKSYLSHTDYVRSSNQVRKLLGCSPMSQSQVSESKKYFQNNQTITS